MSYELGEDGKYTDLPLSNFPENIDEFENKTAVSADNLAIANQYRGYLQNGNYALAAQLRELHPELNSIIIDEVTINKMQQTIQALQRVFRDDIEKYVKDQVFEEDLMVWNYTHSYNSSTKVHNFTGKGVTGRAKITADYHSGDTFAVNGTAVSAYVGSDTPDEDTIANGRWVLFVVDGDTINFSVGGGLTRNKLALATAEENVVLDGYTFYSKGEKTLKTGNIPSKIAEDVIIKPSTSKQSYTFLTKGKYCTENMSVTVPAVASKSGESITITPSTSAQQHIFGTSGYYCTGDMEVNVPAGVPAGTVITVNWHAWNNQQGRPIHECAGGGDISFTINGHNVYITFQTGNAVNSDKYGTTTFTV